MAKLKCMVTLGGLSLLGALAFAVPAQAEIKADCYVEAWGKTYDKDAWPSRWKKPVPVTGGSGRYEFDVFATCVGTGKGLAPEVTYLRGGSTGWYDNVICLSAGSKAYSEGLYFWTQEGGSKAYYAALEAAKYKIVFTVPGQADFYWHEWDKPATPGTKDVIGDVGNQQDYKDPPDKDWQLAGALQIDFPYFSNSKVFSPPDVLANECGASFRMHGVIHVDPRTE